jgi:integrase
MPRDILSELKVRQAKGRDKPYKLHDGAGLYLHVQPNGGRYWRVKFRYQDKERIFAIGVYPDVGLSDARDEALKARRLIQEGNDPVAERKRLRNATAETFRTIAEEWIASKTGTWSPTYKESVETALTANLYPHIGNHPIRSITVPILRNALLIMENKEILAALRKVRMWAEHVFRYAIATGRSDNNPAQLLRGTFKAHKPKNFAAVTTATDFGELIRKISSYEGEVMTRLALLLMAHTVQRTKELRMAKWPEFDLKECNWIIPKERMKMGREHIVPLSRQVIALLQQLKTLNGTSDFVFPNVNNRRKPMSENTMIYGLYRLGYHGRATVHGFRSSASTLLNKMGFNPDWIERQLSHQERNKVRAAYHREQYLEERRGMMQRWSDYIDQLAVSDSAPIASFEKVPAHA